MSSTSIISMRRGNAPQYSFLVPFTFDPEGKRSLESVFLSVMTLGCTPWFPVFPKKRCQEAIGCAGCDFNLSLRAGSIREPFLMLLFHFFRRQKSSQEPQPQPACGHPCLFSACILAVKWWCSAECTRWRGHMSWATALFPCTFHRSI